MNNDNLKSVHRTLISEGYTPPEYEQFAKDMEDDNNLQRVYKTLQKEGYTPPEYETFRKDMGFGVEAQPTESPTAETTADAVPDVTATPQPENGFVQPQFDASKLQATAANEQTGLEKAVAEFGISKDPEQYKKNLVTPGTQEWRTNKVNQPGENPYNGRTYGEIYDEVIRNYGQNIAKQDIDPYAEARAQIIQAGITDDLKPEEADNLTLNIRHGYANRYADNVSKEMISTLPDQVPNIDDLVDGLWYTRDMQARVNHEAARLGLRKENYVNYYLKPHIAKALSDRYGYDVESAKHIAGRLLSQEEHTTDAIRRNEAAGVISEFAGQMINDQYQKLQEAADKASRPTMLNVNGTKEQKFLAALENWQATDPEKVWQQLKPVFDQMGSWLGIVGNEELFDKISQMAEAEGIPVNAYIDQYVIPTYTNAVQKEFERIAVEREMPEDTYEYILDKMGESLVGNIGKWMITSDARRRAQGEALQRTDMGQGEYKPGFGARVAGATAAMLPDIALPYGGPFGLTAAIANRPVAGIAQHLITSGWKPLFARMAQSSASGMASLSAFEGVKGAIQGAINPEGYESILAEDKRNAFEILGDMIKGGFEHAVPSAVMGATMIGGPLGQKISNGRGLLANMLGWGTQVGVDAAGATALSAIQNMPKIIKGDLTADDLTNEFLENVGTFTGLGLHGKAKDFASLAEGGRSINGVPFSKSEVQTIEDVFGKPMRDVIEDVDKLQKSRSLITKSRLGITSKTEKQERNNAIKDAATYLFGNIMKSYQVPADMKVRMCQAFNVPLPEYALKPKVLETFDEAIAKSVDAGWIKKMEDEYNRQGGVTEKLANNEALNDHELTLRLLFQDNKRYNEIGAKIQAGEELTPDEVGFVNSYNQRLEAIQADYFKMEKERLAAEFEKSKGLKRGTIQKMIDDLKQGKGVSNPTVLEEFEAKMGELSQKLDEYKQAKEAAVSEETEAPVAEASVTEEPKINKAPVAEVPVAEEAPVTEEKPITNELPTEEIPPVEIPEETVTVDPQLLVNDETGDIVEVTLVDGRKAYIKSGDPANEFGRVVLVDEQGEPIKMSDESGKYKIEGRIPTNMIARDENGNPLISQPVSIENFGKPVETIEATAEQPKVDTTKETVPVVPEVKADEKGQAVYEESPVEATINDLRTRLGSDEEVAETVDDQISDLTDELAELTKAPKGKAKKHTSMNEKLQKKEAIKATQQKLDYWNSVKEALNKPAEESAKDEQVTEVPVVNENLTTEQPVPATEQTPTAEETAQMKITQGNVKSNLGKNYEFQNQDGTRSVVTLKNFKGNDGVEVMRQDFDAEGNPKGSPYSQELKTLDVSGSIINGFMKPVLTPEEQLREQYKGRKSIQDVLDVVTDEEMQKIIQASQSGDSDAFNSLIDEYRNDHVEDLILKDRDERNAKVSEIMNGPGTRESKLRRIRKIYQDGNFEDAVTALEDDTLAPVSVEGIVADMHNRQPKKGEGPIAYFSYTAPDGHEVIGMQDESGHGKKTSGDTKGYAPWLAPQGKGMSLTQYAENLRSQMTEAQQEQYDVQDVRNAVINLFGSAEKPSDITTMSIKNGVLQAEQAARRLEEHWIDNVNYQKVSHDEKSFAGRLAKAKQTTNTEPTEAQKEKGNYKKGHVSFGGYDFVIENPEGSMRRGKDADGKEWEQKMNNTYGYILGKYGKDGDHLDMFINDGQDLDNWNGKVYVVDQIDPKTGLFDEHKVMYGFNSEAEARDAYLSNYEKGWKGLGAITGVSKEAFDKWLDSSKRKLIRFADHSITKEALEKQANEPATDADIELAFRDKIMDIEKNSGVPLTTDMEEAMPILNRENGKQVDQHKAYHGSGAEFDAFDHSHMGEGEGYQTFGYGTYVTEVPNIAKGYAEKGATKKYNRLNPGYGGKEIFYKGKKIDLQTINPLKMAYDMINNMGTVKKAIEKCDKFVDIAEDPEMKQMWRDTIDILKNSKKSDFKARMADLEGQRYVYDVEIPDDNGENYLDYELKPTDKQVHNIVSQLYKLHMEDIVKEQRIATMIRNANSIGDIIDVLHQYIGGKATAKLLHDAGYVGTKYPTNYMAGRNREGTKNYVIYDENDAKITDTTKFFKTNDGYAYGFTYRGKIYIDPSIATSETPIHEYGHLWAEMKRQSAPEEWNHIKQTLLADKLVEPFIEKVKRDYPELTGEGKEDDFVEEVLTQFSGKHGAEKLRKMAQEIKKELGGDATAETIAEAAIRRVKSVLNDFWKSVCGMMGWKYTNAEDIADALLRDLLNGVNPVEKMKEMPKELKSQGEIERTLMGMHNISEEKLKKAIKLGGLANPSMAVVDTKNGVLDNFGEISLIPKSDLIDKKKGRNVGTWASDTYTPRFPKTYLRISDKNRKALNKWLDSLGVNDEMRYQLGQQFNDYYNSFDIREDALQYAFLHEKGLTDKVDYVRHDDVSPAFLELVDKYGNNIEEMVMRTREDEDFRKEISDKVISFETTNAMKDVRRNEGETAREYMDRRKEYARVIRKLLTDENDIATFSLTDHFLRDNASKMQANGKFDPRETLLRTRDYIRKNGLEEEYAKYFADKSKELGIEEMVANGHDRNGRLKFKPITLEDISKQMKKEGRAGGEGGFGDSPGALRAKLTPMLNSLEEMRKEKGRLVSHEDFEAKKDPYFEKVFHIQHDLFNGDYDDMLKVLRTSDMEAAAKRLGYDLTPEEVDDLKVFKNLTMNLPTEYFETKFERPVMLNEFEIAVVPENTDPEVVKALKDAGVDVRTYSSPADNPDGGRENRRNAIMDAVIGRDDIRFQMVGEKGAAEADKAEGVKTRQESLKVAEELEKADKSSKAIKFATGWERGKDGKWRYETVDEKADILDDYNQKVIDYNNKRSEFHKGQGRLLDLYQQMDMKIPKRADSKKYSEEEQAKFREMRKERDKVWKQYMDSMDQEKEFMKESKDAYTTKLVDLLGENHELFKYYPQLKDLTVRYAKNMQQGVAGSYNDKEGIKIGIGQMHVFGDNNDLNNDNVNGILLHEIQHAIQDIEGFAKGGNLYTATTEAGINAIVQKKQAERDVISTKMDMYRKWLNNPEELKLISQLDRRTVEDEKKHMEEMLDELTYQYDRIGMYIDKIKHDKAPAMSDARDLYSRLAGEVEARNASERINMSEQERRNTPIEKTEDYSRENQVVMMDYPDDGESASFTNSKEEFDKLLKRAVKEKGIVTPDLANTEVAVISVPKHDFTSKKPIDEAIGWAKKNLVTTKDDVKEGNLPKMKDGTPYTISNKAVGKYLSKSAVEKSDGLDIHLSVLKKLKDVIGESIDTEIRPDYPKDEKGNRNPDKYNDNSLIHILYGAVNIDGKTYRVKTVMQEFRGNETSKPHSYEVTKIELLDSPMTASESPSVNIGQSIADAKESTNNSITGANLLQKVEKSKDLGKYLLDESKKAQEKEEKSSNINPMSEDFPRFSKVRKPTPHQMNEEIRKKKEERNLEVAKKRAAEEGGIKEPNRQAFEVEALKRYDKDVDDWKQRHGLSGERPRTDGPEMDKWLEAEADRKDPKPNVFDYTGDKEYREAYDDYLKKIEKYKSDETLELTKDDVINEREMQVRTPAQKITTGIATTLARDYSGEQASDAVREGVIERRRNIEELSADDSLYINNLKEQTDNLAKELSGDKYDGDDAMSRLMNAVEARKKGKQHISGKDIRDALPFIVEAPMRRHDIARDINDVLAQVKSPCRVSGEDLKAAEDWLYILREEAPQLLEINRKMADEERTEMTEAEKKVYEDVKQTADGIARSINNRPGREDTPLTADDVMAALSYFAKPIVPKGLKVNEDMPELQSIINGIRDWYRTAYTWLDEAGMRKENVGYFENYVNHVWSSKKSDPDAYDTLVANRQPTTSRNMKQRQVRTYMEGIEAGLVPEFSEITDMMGDYSKKNILAWANKKMLNDLSFIDVIERNDEGEVTAIFPMMSSKAPSLYGLDKYQYYEVPGVGALWVYKDAADNFSQIFEQYEVGTLMKYYDAAASMAKKIELSWSGFHAGALSEVYAVQNSIEFGPKKTAQYFYKYLIKDCLESGLSPAYANPEAYRSAAKHFVKLGATDDYSAPAVQNMSDTMVNFIAGLRNNLKGRGVIGEGGALAISPLELAATAVKLINEGSDKVLWTWLHDGLKIATFRMMEDRTNSAMEARFQKQHPEMSLDEIHKMKEYQTELNKQLDRDGQYVNDMFGGQHWELINISPKVLRRLRRFLLSPDWLISTQRHFLGSFGYGDIHSKARLRDFNKFYKAILGDKVEFDAESLPGMYAGLIGKGAKAVGLKGKNINEWADMNLPQGRIRRAVSSLLCYAIGVNIFYDIANNIVNAIMRKWDEKQEEQKEKDNEGYVSKYKLMYPDGMKWFDRKRLDWNPMHMFGITNMIFGDYGMEGNALGKKTHVFGGHYDEGAEIYLRTGKQFKEFPDFWENEKGELEFPRPLINRLMGKANPNIRMLYNTLNYYTRWDKSYDDKQLEERIKKFSDNKTFVGVLAGLTKLGENYKPFWVPTQDGKNWVFTDTFFPSSKGFSAHKAREYFEQFMRAGDQEGYMETVRACILNGMSDEKIERAIKSAENGIKAEQRKQAVEDQQTLEGMMIEFNGTNNLTKRKALYKKIYTELGNETPKAPKTYDEFQEWFTDYLNGVDRSLKVNDKYLERAMAQDMAEEARISQLKHRIEDLQGEIKDMENSGATAEQIKAYSEQPDNMRLLKANDIINAYKNDRKNDPGYDSYKKELGKEPFRANGELIDDAWRMRKIREMRQEMLKEIEKLGK